MRNNYVSLTNGAWANPKTWKEEIQQLAITDEQTKFALDNLREVFTQDWCSGELRNEVESYKNYCRTLIQDGPPQCQDTLSQLLHRITQAEALDIAQARTLCDNNDLLVFDLNIDHPFFTFALGKTFLPFQHLYELGTSIGIVKKQGHLLQNHIDRLHNRSLPTFYGAMFEVRFMSWLSYLGIRFSVVDRGGSKNAVPELITNDNCIFEVKHMQLYEYPHDYNMLHRMLSHQWPLWSLVSGDNLRGFHIYPQIVKTFRRKYNKDAVKY